MSPRQNLENLADRGSLNREVPNAEAIGNHIAKANNLKADAQKSQDSLDGRFNNAYAAGHHFLTAALRMKGYRPVEGRGGRSMLYQLLDQLLPGAAGSQALLQRENDLRNREEYDEPMHITERLVSDLIVAVQNVGEEANLQWKRFSRSQEPPLEKHRRPRGERSR